MGQIKNIKLHIVTDIKIKVTTMEVGVITEFSGEQACISVWNLTTGVRLKIYKNCTCGRNAFDFIANNYLIAAQHGKQLLQIYDTQNERLVKRIVCPGKISALIVSPDSNYCVVALLEKIYIWHISSGNLINIISKHYQNITSMKFTNDGSLLVTCGEDNLVLVWRLRICCNRGIRSAIKTSAMSRCIR